MTLVADSPTVRRIFDRDGVEVWEFDLDRSLEEVDALWGLLDEGERRQAARLGSARLRERFIVRRGVRRQVLAERLGTAPERLEFELGPFGKPWLAGRGLQFSASSSEGKAVLAVSKIAEVGVDVERIRPDFDFAGPLAAHFSPEERGAWGEATAAQFFAAWTRKEAGVKALGVGLRGFGLEMEATRARNLEMGSFWAAALALGADGSGSCGPNGQNPPGDP